MARPSPKFEFGEWLPDQPELDNPGLIEALNVLKVSGNYVPYAPLATSGDTLPDTVCAAMLAVGSGGSNLYVGTQGPTNAFLYVGVSGISPWINKSAASFTLNQQWSFSQYAETVVATNFADDPQYHTLGGGGNFAKLTGAYGDAPKAYCVGVIGQFVVLGNLVAAQYAVQWCGINAPLNWPTPNSDQAIAQQSGIQFLDPALGIVVGITQGDQWGLILMTGGIVRMTYTGGDTVFQFDTIYRAPGCLELNAWIKVGELVYYASRAGFFVCDGTKVTPIGHAKVDEYFLTNANMLLGTNVFAGVDYATRQIYWTFIKPGFSTQTEVLAFSMDEGSWTHASDTIAVFARNENGADETGALQAFSVGNTQGQLIGTPGIANLVTAEKEFNPGGRALIKGFKPLVTNVGTISVRIQSRNNLTSSVTNSSPLTPNASSGFCDALVDARYHRAQILITGTFKNALGGEFDLDPTSIY